MKYKLINEELANKRNVLSVQEIVLKNRGIEDWQAYLNTDDGALLPYELLDNIEQAKDCLLQHIENKSNIIIIVDDDNDGITSSAMLYNYLHSIYPDINLKYLIHTRKSHGLSDDIVIPENTDLVILPDAGTNEVDESKALKEKGIDIIVLDHHIQEKDNPYAIIVNCQTSKHYSNKSLSGSGMVYKFLKCLDDATWENRADDFLDLAALGIIGDSMDIRTLENKRIIDLGLSNIRNKAFQAFINKQSYSINGVVNITNCQYYIVPLINGIIRNNNCIEKETMFKAFCELDEYFDYQKNSKTEMVKEDIYTRSARLAVNAKARQNKLLEKEIERLNGDIEKHDWNKNQLLFVNGEGLEGSLTGLTAMKLSNAYNKPCLIIRESSYEEGCLTGSMRNYSGSPIDSLKEFLEETGLFEYVKGHNNAAGICLKIENRKKAIEKTNEMLKDFSFEKIYRVDFILDPEELNYEFICETDQLKDYYGQNISEVLVLIKNIRINTNDIKIIGEKKDTWKFSVNDELSIIKFKCNAEDKVIQTIDNNWGGEELILNIIGRPGINDFNNIKVPQIAIVDYEIQEGK